MSHTLLRQWLMLKSVPRYPRRISTVLLQQLLNEEGFQVSLRTVQRDLIRLATIFPGLRTDGNKDVAGWYWVKGCQAMDIPAIDPPMALTFKLAQSFLDSLIPPSVLEMLRPYLQASDQILEQLDDRGFKHWNDKIAVVPRTQPLIPAEVDPGVIEVVYDSLLRQVRFRGRYRTRDDKEKEYVFKPYGLVYQNSVIYLVASMWNYEDPRHFALHRFVQCESLDEPFDFPESFDLQQYIASGAFEYTVGDGGEIKLVARFTPEAGYHLQETPLSRDQKIVRKRNGWLEVQATVKNTRQLRWWLLGFGNQVKVIRPKTLQQELARCACSDS